MKSILSIYQVKQLLGYQGHVPGLISDNLHSKPFTQLTKKAICGKLDNAFDIPPEKKYKTHYNANFNRKAFPRTNLEQDVPRDKANFEEFSSTQQSNLNKVTNILSGIPMVGYQGFHSLYRLPPASVGIQDGGGYLGNTKTILTSSKMGVGVCEDKSVVVPVTGYTGFRPSVKAKNYYGKCFRETSMASKVAVNEK